MIVYIVRHAWAGHFGDPDWPNDFDRPLSEEGRQRFARVVERLTERGFRPEMVATSPLVRCRQTAEVIVAGLDFEPNLVEREELVPGSNLPGILEWTTQHAAKANEVAWVGHAPDVGQMTAALVGDSEAWFRFAKGAVAAIQFDDTPELGEGELRWLTTAKLLGC